MITVEIAAAILSEYSDDGFLGVATDSHGDSSKGLPSYEAIHPLGLISRPRDPDANDDGSPSTSATAIRFIGGNEEHVMAVGDCRATPKLPRLDKGSVALYADSGNATIPFLLLSGLDGSAQLYVPYRGTAATLAFDVSTEGAESIQIIHGAGMGFSMTAGGKNDCILHNRQGTAYIGVNDDGLKLNGNLQTVGATQLGAQATLLDPVPQAIALAAPIQSYATVNAVLLGQLIAQVNLLAPGSITAPVPVLSPTVAATKVTAA